MNVRVHAEPPGDPVPRIRFGRRLPGASERIAEGGRRARETGVGGQSREEVSPDRPTFSIVTVVLNQVGGIGRTMESVLRQAQPPPEYVIVDGGSTDGTVDVIRRYDDAVDSWVSEPDRGISDAFNKGVSLCSGEWVGLLNAGDWYEPDALSVMAKAATSDVDFLFAACRYHPVGGIPVVRPPDPYYGRKIAFFMPQIHHPSVFVRRAVYERYGGFDIGLRCAMDYDFLLRIHKAGCRGRAVPATIVNMVEDGVSVREYPRVRDEVRRVSVRHGLPRWVARLTWAGFMGVDRIRKGLSRP